MPDTEIGNSPVSPDLTPTAVDIQPEPGERVEPEPGNEDG